MAAGHVIGAVAGHVGALVVGVFAPEGTAVLSSLGRGEGTRGRRCGVFRVATSGASGAKAHLLAFGMCGAPARAAVLVVAKAGDLKGALPGPRSPARTGARANPHASGGGGRNAEVNAARLGYGGLILAGRAPSGPAYGVGGALRRPLLIAARPAAKREVSPRGVAFPRAGPTTGAPLGARAKASNGGSLTAPRASPGVAGLHLALSSMRSRRKAGPRLRTPPSGGRRLALGGLGAVVFNGPVACPSTLGRGSA